MNPQSSAPARNAPGPAAAPQVAPSQFRPGVSPIQQAPQMQQQPPQGAAGAARPTGPPSFRPAFRPPFTGGPQGNHQGNPQGNPQGNFHGGPQGFRPPAPQGPQGPQGPPAMRQQPQRPQMQQQPPPQQQQQQPPPHQQQQFPPNQQQFALKQQHPSIGTAVQGAPDPLSQQFGAMALASPPNMQPAHPGQPLARAQPPGMPGVPGMPAMPGSARGLASAAPAAVPDQPPPPATGPSATKSKRVYPGMPMQQPQQQMPLQQPPAPFPPQQQQQQQQPGTMYPQQPNMPPQMQQQAQYQPGLQQPPQQLQQPQQQQYAPQQQQYTPQQQYQPMQQQMQPPMQQQMQQMQPQMQQQMQQPMQASKHRINPDHIPSPVALHEADQVVYSTSPYMTMSRTMPPLAATRCTVFDNGNSSPKFIRSTLYTVPATDELLAMSALPFGIILQPLAETDPGDTRVPLADFGTLGPVRCSRCKAYVNPFFQFVQGGRKFLCNMCSFENDVPTEYFENLDMNGRRIDINQRPELLCGSCDFTVTPEYSARPAKPASYIFAIDVSHNSVRSGMLATCVSALKHFLYSGQYTLPTGATVGIITFDRAVHFYNLRPNLDKFQMMVVGDVNEMFVPISHGMLVDPVASKRIVEGLLDALPALFAETTITEAALGAACQAAHGALAQFGGKLSVFQTSLPVFGPGALKHREDPKLLGSDRENKLYEPQEYFWKKLGEDCVAKGVCVDSYLFPSSYIDVATTGALSAITGGDTMMYTNFDASRDGEKFANDLQRGLARLFGFDAILRVRVSNGLKVGGYFGNFLNKNNIDIELSGIDSLKAIGVALKHDGKLDDKLDVYIQSALLYTTADGSRRVRVHNLSLPVTSQLSNVFRQAELDTSINLLVRAAIADAVNSPLKQIREGLSARCIKVLASYRINISTQSSPGQLILPESYKLYPLYVLALLKSRALRGGKPMPSDMRIASMRMFNMMGVTESVAYLYPTMYEVTAMEATVGEMSAQGVMTLPPVIRMSAERMSTQGLYLAENGRQMFLWIGRDVPPERLRSIFGVDSLQQIHIASPCRLPIIDTPESTQLRTVVAYIQGIRPRFPRLVIVRQGLDQAQEARFSNFFVEDPNHDNLSYVDFLVLIHKNVQNETMNSR